MEETSALREKLEKVCSEFCLSGEISEFELITSGHINTTYRVVISSGKEAKEYLAQKVNWYVFKNPVSVMRNIDLITSYIISRNPTQERRRRLHYYHTVDDENYLILDDGEEKEFWRVCNFIENSVSFETASGNPEVLRMSGKAFGQFEKQLKDFDASKLAQTIPHFHDTRHRLNTFFSHVEEDLLGRASECRDEIEFIRSNVDFACRLNEMVDRGELPLRVTHNDTKANNVMFDRETLEPLVVVDLDTCMPGLVCHDFGDTVRFAACRGSENDNNLVNMKVDLELYRAFAEGFLGETKDFLTDEEIESLAPGAATITLELASRFLDDYLTGDKYFRTDYVGENLDRARSQLALFKDMMIHLDEMNDIVRSVSGRKTI